MISRHPDTAEKKARFVHFLKEAGGEGRKDIRTYFDLIEFDEGRLQVEFSRDQTSSETCLERRDDYFANCAKILFASSSVSLLPMSYQVPLI